jgi:valyl-tRNA synthetase
VRSGAIRIVPERFTKVYYNWLENIEDWCISRQLWWGHRIPVWYCDDCHEMIVARQDPEFCSHCMSKRIHQDSDVLDTWFSSGLWPFSTLGWPDSDPDYLYFYPTTMMETGYDILFFWVARMIMAGLEFTGKIPFDTVYLHGLIRDEHGRKMSKTYGNVIDPLVVMDEMGTDALRFTLLVGSTPGNDMNLSVKKVEANRNFANKIWNASRMVLNALNQVPERAIQKPEWTLADSWIWARVQVLVRDVERLFQNYQYGEAGRQIYEFFWGEFADWYLEIAKYQLSEGGDRAYYTGSTLVRVLDLCLRLLHPFTPFITEELWGYLKRAVQSSPLANIVMDWTDALIIAPWPTTRKVESWEEEKIADFTMIQDIVRSVRNIRSEKNVPTNKRLPGMISAGERYELVRSQARVIAALGNFDLDRLEIVADLKEKPLGHIVLIVGSIEIYLPLTDLIDRSEELNRLRKALSEAESQVARLEKLLAGPFVEKAPAEIVQKERDKLKGFLESVERLRAQLISSE